MCPRSMAPPDRRSEGMQAFDLVNEALLEEWMDWVAFREQLWIGGTIEEEDVKVGGRRKKNPETKFKVYRRKSFEAAIDLDNAMRHIGGLQHFQVTSSMRKKVNPLAWPHLNACSDCGPDVYCMLVFLERALNLNLSRHPDVSHASHNDVMLSIFDVNLGPLMYLLCVCVNLPFLPWGDGRFGGMVFSCAREFELLHDEANVLFQFYIERLARTRSG